MQLDIQGAKSTIVEKEYFQIKTAQKKSVKLLTVLCIQLTDLNLNYDRAVLKHCLCRKCMWTLRALRGLWWKKEYIQIKTTQKQSVKHLTVLFFKLTMLNLNFD